MTPNQKSKKLIKVIEGKIPEAVCQLELDRSGKDFYYTLVVRTPEFSKEEQDFIQGLNTDPELEVFYYPPKLQSPPPIFQNLIKESNQPKRGRNAAKKV